jgi:hypothetical protein
MQTKRGKGNERRRTNLARIVRLQQQNLGEKNQKKTRIGRRIV